MKHDEHTKNMKQKLSDCITMTDEDLEKFGHVIVKSKNVIDQFCNLYNNDKNANSTMSFVPLDEERAKEIKNIAECMAEYYSQRMNVFKQEEIEIKEYIHNEMMLQENNVRLIMDTVALNDAIQEIALLVDVNIDGSQEEKQQS